MSQIVSQLAIFVHIKNMTLKILKVKNKIGLPEITINIKQWIPPYYW